MGIPIGDLRISERGTPQPFYPNCRTNDLSSLELKSDGDGVQPTSDGLQPTT